MIKGISEIRRMPRIGKIHLGVKNKNEKGVAYPSAVDYFVIDEKSTPKEILKKVKEIYGEKPRKLIIKFFSNELEQIFPQFLKYYSKGQLICRGDGEKAIRRNENGEFTEITCPYKDCEFYKQRLCRPVAHLKFYLDGIPGGFFQVDTSSINSIINLNTKIEQLKLAYGNIVGMPLELSLVPIQVQVKDDKSTKSFNKTAYILDIHEKNFEDNKDNNILEDFDIEGEGQDEDFVPEGFEVVDDENDPFANTDQNKEMLMLDKFGKIQIKGKDYVLATFLDSQNRTHNFIITNKDIYVDLNTAKKSGQNPVIYDYQTEDFEGYEVLMEYKKLV